MAWGPGQPPAPRAWAMVRGHTLCWCQGTAGCLPADGLPRRDLRVWCGPGVLPTPAPFLAGPRPTRVSSTWASWLRGQGPPSRGGGRGDSVLRTEPLRDAAQPLPRQHLPAAPRPSNGDRGGRGRHPSCCGQTEPAPPDSTPGSERRSGRGAPGRSRGWRAVEARGAQREGAGCSTRGCSVLSMRVFADQAPEPPAPRVAGGPAAAAAPGSLVHTRAGLPRTPPLSSNRVPGGSPARRGCNAGYGFERLGRRL